MLTTEGYEVIEATNGLQGLERLELCAPDVIFLDMNMPIMNGWMFLMSYLDSSKSHPPIIASSAQFMNPKNIPGICAFLPKPFDVMQLRKMIDQHVGRSAAV